MRLRRAERGHYDRLKSARAESLRLLQEPLDASDETWATYLQPTATRLLVAWSELARDDEFWDRIAAAEIATAELTDLEALRLQEMLDVDLVDLLDLLDYGPPPPSSQLALELQEALTSVLNEPSRARRAARTRTAQKSLIIYTYHLRSLIQAAAEPAGSETEVRSRRARVIASARRGARAAAPGVVAAGISAAVLPPAGVAGAAAAVTHGGVEALREFTKQGVQAATTSLMAEMMTAEVDDADPAVVYAASVHQFAHAATQLGDALDEIARTAPSEIPDDVRGLSIETLHWLYEVLRQQAIIPGRRHLMRPAMNAALDGLRDLQEWIEEAEDYLDYEEIVDRLRAALNHADRKLNSHVNALSIHLS